MKMGFYWHPRFAKAHFWLRGRPICGDRRIRKMNLDVLEFSYWPQLNRCRRCEKAMKSIAEFIPKKHWPWKSL